jgi:hypothetical protein
LATAGDSKANATLNTKSAPPIKSNNGLDDCPLPVSGRKLGSSGVGEATVSGVGGFVGCGGGGGSVGVGVGGTGVGGTGVGGTGVDVGAGVGVMPYAGRA